MCHNKPDLTGSILQLLAMLKRANRYRRIVQLVVGVVVVGPQAQQRNGVDAETLSLVGALDTTVDIVRVRERVRRGGFDMFFLQARKRMSKSQTQPTTLSCTQILRTLFPSPEPPRRVLI
jgi:hypothetical protein